VTHMVIFRSPEGKPGYHQAEGLDEAMRFAEMLRNQEQVTDARIFRMDEVPIEFKTYYRVEVAAAGSGDTASAAGTGDTASAAGSGDTASAAGSGDTASAAGSGEVTETPDVPEGEQGRQAVSEPEGDDARLEPVAVATGKGAELEAADAGAFGPGRHGRFPRR